MNSTKIKSMLLGSTTALVGQFVFSAVPEVTSVSMQQAEDSRLVTITYALANAPAVVTLDIQTNDTATGNWASIGGENIQNFTEDSAVWKRIDTAGTHSIKWRPDLSWPDHKIADGGARAIVTAWALDNTPDYMVVDISAAATQNSQRYYPGEDFLPGGVLSNHAYRTTSLLMRKIMAKNVTWTMGSVNEKLRLAAREATHTVTLTNNYYIGVFPVTQTQWFLISEYNNSWFSKEGYRAMRPVEYLCYNEIRCGRNGTGINSACEWPNEPYSDSFLGRLNARTGLDFDLPLEAEWEYAARAGNGEGKWGDGSAYITTDGVIDGNLPGRYVDNSSASEIDALANSAANSAIYDDSVATATVGTYGKNNWGLYDMHGNVWEFCRDFYQEDITTYNGKLNISPSNSAQTLDGTDCRLKVIRGGSWRNPAFYCRSAYRDYTDSTNRHKSYGLRVSCRAGLQ